MNQHYQNAINALNELGRLTGGGSEISAVGAIQAQATLAVAKETAELRKAQDLGNLIAYAQLSAGRRKWELYSATLKLIDEKMLSTPALKTASENDAKHEDEDGF
jgi:hypothetical protein